MSNRNIPEGRLRDPLYRALEAGNLRAAEALLDKRESLSWYETAIYAPLALRRPIRLLRRILDLGPEGQVYCAGLFTRPGGGWTIRVCATLLIAAAALDDLPAVEELIRRGYYLDYFSINREYYPNAVREWTDDMWKWRRETENQQFHLDMVRLEPEGEPYVVLKSNEPLSAAICCGALRCVERLLPERGKELSLSARNELSLGPQPGDEERRQAVVDLVQRKYGMELAELLEPGEFLDRGSPLFLPCLEKHPEWFNRTIAKQFVEWSAEEPRGKEKNWAWEALPLIPEQLMTEVILEKMREGFWYKRDSPLQGLYRHPLVHLTVDRCAVPADTGQRQVLEIIDHMEITGDPPGGGLSGLAVAMLNAMLFALRGRDDLELQCRRRLVENPRALAVLSIENPEMLLAYLNWKAEERAFPDKNILVLMKILNLREERHYEL